jgi:hypothetical protein
MSERKVDIRRHGPLSERSGVTTLLDGQEQSAPTGRDREFRDAMMRATGAVEGIPTLIKEWGRWDV